jgi:hypothetical protein
MNDTNRRRATALLAALAALLGALPVGAQTTDFCGCGGSPSLGAFVSNDASTHPPGTVGLMNQFGSYDHGIRIPLPPDGVLVFDSFVVNGYPGNPYTYTVSVHFEQNAANTPVTLLVKGDVTIPSNMRIRVSGWSGGAGSAGNAGGPGQGGPGGFAGGQGAFEIVNFAEMGGNGVGPGGGLGATIDPLAIAQGGTFVGVPELRPLLGGSGGGGGRSVAGTTNAAAGGGGGGGGAILIAANGTIDIGGLVLADGGNGGNRFANPATAGAGGSGGAIRLLANRIQGGGNIYARGGAAGAADATYGANAGGAGRIRMEALFNTFAADNTSPLAVRAPAPGPLVNPITPTVRITGIDGAATPANPIGFRNELDMVVDAPGVIQVDLATTDVPAGTDVAVTVKPKIGGLPTTQTVTLASCASGACTAAASFDLAAGAYVVEARATFQTP